jgi:hypothetical protein
MSALGQKQTSRVVRLMSAPDPIADIGAPSCEADCIRRQKFRLGGGSIGWRHDFGTHGVALLTADADETPLPGAPAPHRSDARRRRASATRSPGPVPGTRRLARAGRAAACRNGTTNQMRAERLVTVFLELLSIGSAWVSEKTTD